MDVPRAAKPDWKRSFFTIAAGQTVSLIGSSAVQFAMIWWLASQTDSPMALSMASLATFLPMLALGPFAGVWIDRLRRKRVIIAADLFLGLVAAVFAYVYYRGQPPYWSVYAVIGLRSVGSVFHTPALQAAIPMLVPQDQLVRANGYSQFLQSGSFMLGPVLGAAMYAALPMHVILLTDLAGALFACAGVALVRIPDPPRMKHKPRFLSEMKEGLLALLHHRPTAVVLGFATLSMMFLLPLSSFYPLMSSTYFSLTAWHASVVELVYAGGMLLAAALASAIGPRMRRKLNWAHLGMALMGASCALSGVLPATMPGFWAFAVLCAVMGAAANLYNIPFTAHLQQIIPPDKQGRAFSVIASLMSAAMALGLVLAGPVAERHGVTLWFLLAGLAMCALTGVSYILSKET